MFIAAFRPLPILFAAALLPSLASAQDTATTALTRCLAIAGAPDAGVPVSPAAQAAALDALAQARIYCAEAAAVEPPDPAALFHLAVAEQREGDHEAAISGFEVAAAAGLAAAETKLGDYFNFGIGPVRADADQAIAHYRSAAAQGDLPAVTTLAFMYRLGRGVRRSTARMMGLMTEAADGGYHFAQYRLAQTYLTGDGIPGGSDVDLGVPDPAQAVRYFRMAAMQGNLDALGELATLYADDGNGVPENAAAQALWTRRAAEAGVPEALNALGFLHERGRGMTYDPVRAAQLYIQALEAGVDFDDIRGTVNGYTPGWERQTAIEFQLILQARGLYPGPIDAIVGWGTTAGARAVAGN